MVVDLETTGLNHKTDRIVSIAFTHPSGKTISYPVNHPESDITEREAFDKTQHIISRSNLLIGHNIKFDLLFLKEWGIDFTHCNLYDTQIGEYLLSHQLLSRVSLKDLAEKYDTSRKIDGFDFSVKRADEYPLKPLLEYNEGDTKATCEIYLKQWPKLVKAGLDKVMKVTCNFTKVLVDIECDGIHVNGDQLRLLKDDTALQLSEMQSKLVSMFEYPININSSQQLSSALFGGKFKVDSTEKVRIKRKTWPIYMWKERKCKGEISLEGMGFGTSKLKKNANGYYPTDSDTILKLKGRSKKQKEFLSLYRLYNKLNTLYVKYLTKYDEHIYNGFIHASFQQCVTKTGRLSCISPNIQQVPRTEDGLPNIKDLFTSRWAKGVLLEVDFSQLEWRIAADLCNDRSMQEEIIKGIDAHKVNASLAFNIPPEQVTKQERQIAKMVSFGVIYGQTAWGMANNRADIPVETEEDAQTIIDTIYNKYPGLKIWHHKQLALAKAKGVLISPSGRIYNFKGDRYKQTNIKNYPVQGFATADIAPAVFYECYKRLLTSGLDYRIINTVHDCLMFDCRDEGTALRVNDIVSATFKDTNRICKEVFGYNLKVPIDSESEMGYSWGQMREIH